MTPKEELDRLVAHIEACVPGFELRYKAMKYLDDPWQRAVIDRVAPIFAEDFFRNYATTVYPFVYVPSNWAHDYQLLYRILRHEFIHLMDEQRYGLWFTSSYVAVAPTLITMRAYWERRGYAQTLVEIHERRGIKQHDIDFVVSQFTSKNYFFMDPWAKEKIEHLVGRIQNYEIRGLWPYNSASYER